MNKITPLLILVLIVGVVSVSGCIHYVGNDTEPSSDAIIINDTQTPTNNNTATDSIKKANQSDSNNNKKTEEKNATPATPKISTDQAKELMNSELKTNYSIENAEYNMTTYLNNSTPHYNITVYTGNGNEKDNVGTAYMNAESGEIIYINITVKNENSTTTTTSTQKIYSADEAGAFVDIVYKGVHVSVRENYPYYSPQNEKVYYSQQEEAEDLYQLSKAMN